ncbi:MAG: dihydropteroate synthase, partial [Candidatus Hodarchaeota archaeon]
MTPRTVRIGTTELGREHPVCVMGVVNLSPESFYKESIRVEVEDIVNMVAQMEREGAGIIDIGGASTAPKAIYGTLDITSEEELKRVETAMEGLRDAVDIPISVDTFSSQVAETALDLGASMINDITGLQGDPSMAKLLSDRDVPVVLMAKCADPCSSVEQSIGAIKKSIEIAKTAGIRDERIIIDPGIGFGKPADVDFSLLRELGRFVKFGYPVLVGVSRKAFIGNLLDQPEPSERLFGTIAATSIAVQNGASLIRAHDVREASMAVRLGEAVRKGPPLVSQNIELVEIRNEHEGEIVIDSVGAGREISRALSRKAAMVNLKLYSVQTPAALIIKQEMLAIGGDAAYHYDTIDFGVKTTDVLVMGTVLQVARLAQ